MVLVDGKAVLSCITKVISLQGAEVTTIEGLGTPDRPNLVQQAFVLAGAVQCGFCIPGMIVTAEELLAANPDPTRAEVKRALRRNLCRCTGYVKIIDAVQLAGRFIRGEITPAELVPDPDAPKIGTSFPRPQRHGQGHRHGAVRRRHPAAGRARDRGGPQPARPRAGSAASTPRQRPRCRASRAS